MTDFTSKFSHSRELGGLWVESEHCPDYFPGHGTEAYKHQLAMRSELSGEDRSVVVNTNPTGAGKTRSWVVPTLRAGEDGSGEFVIATYPTNALVEDQRQSLHELITRYFEADHEAIADATVVERDEEKLVRRNGREFPLSDLVRTVSGATTTGSTADALNRAGEDVPPITEAGLPVIVLTTPDTLTLAGLEQYFDPDVGTVPSLADRIVVDEFHLANPRGRRLLPFVLDLYRRLVGDELSIVFLSATPDGEYVSRLERAFDVTVVGRPISTEQPSSGGSQILPPARLHVQSRDMFTNGAWIAEKADMLVEWNRDEGQLLVIVDSVREVETVYEAFVARLGESRVGRIYGWKRRGRQSVIENRDVIVGNTAMEVGVDFARVSQVVCTAYDAASAIQRIGRMRARANLSDHEICLLTTPDVQTALAHAGNRIERPELGEILGRHLDPVRVAPYYEMLVATLTRYLWSDGSLGRAIKQDDKSVYQQTVADHFGHVLPDLSQTEVQVDAATVWEETGELLDEYREEDGTAPTFEEMSSFRSGSLTVAVLDTTDPEEPVKTASLGSVLRNRHGRILPDRAALEREYEDRYGTIQAADRRLLDRSEPYTCGYFLSTGRRDGTGSYRLTSSGFENEQLARRDNASAFEPTPDRIETVRVETTVDIGGTTADLDTDGEVLAHHVDEDPSSARQAYALGRYANLVSVGDDESLALWQDAILTHARDVWERMRES